MAHTTARLDSPSNSFSLPALLRRALTANKPLAVVGLGFILFAAVTLLGLAVDPRTVLNAPAWLKPFKFGISTAFYSFTLLWVLNFVQGHRRWVSVISWITTVGFAIEIALISLQAARGVPSHFNVSTQFDGVLYSVMGSIIMVIWLASLVAVILLIRQRMTDAALGWAVRLGLIAAVAGAGVGMLMTQPTPANLDYIAEHQAPPPTIGAHSVGATDGGPGLPIVGWSIEGGDLRVGHFVGLHGMQLVPLLAWLLLRRFPRLSDGRRLALAWTVGLGYLGLTGLLTWQALRGQSLIAPDALTLGALAALTVAIVGALALITRQSHHTVNA